MTAINIMTKPIILLLLITIPFQGVLYAMPVPSEGDDQKTVPVHGGGAQDWDVSHLVLAALAFSAVAVSNELTPRDEYTVNNRNTCLLLTAFFGGFALLAAFEPGYYMEKSPESPSVRWQKTLWPSLMEDD